MKKSIYLFAALAGLCCFSSCNKDDDRPSPVQPDQKALLLTSKTWIVTDSEDSTGGTWVNTYAGLDSCSKDDELKFTAERFTLEQGPAKCNPDDPQITGKGTWRFIGVDRDYLLMDFDNSSHDPIPVKIITLNGTTLQISYWVEDSQWNIHYYRRTYTAR